MGMLIISYFSSLHKEVDQGASPSKFRCFPVTTVQTVQAFSEFTVSLVLCLAGHWLLHDLVQSGQCPRTLRNSQGRKLPYCPALLSPDHSHWYAEREGRALPPIHLETRIQTQEFLRGSFHFVALDLEELYTSQLLRIPQILFLTLDCAHIMFIYQGRIKCMGFYFVLIRLDQYTLYESVEIQSHGCKLSYLNVLEH